MRDLFIATAYAILGGAVALALTAMPVKAGETFELSRHGAWTVNFVSLDRTNACEMETANRFGERLTLTVLPTDTYGLFVHFIPTTGTPQDMIDYWDEGRGFNWIELTTGHRSFRFKPETVEHSGQGPRFAFMGMWDVNYDFRQAMAEGTWIEFPDLEAHWSLVGSAAALRSLDNCRKRLGAF